MASTLSSLASSLRTSSLMLCTSVIMFAVDAAPTPTRKLGDDTFTIQTGNEIAGAAAANSALTGTGQATSTVSNIIWGPGVSIVLGLVFILGLVQAARGQKEAGFWMMGIAVIGGIAKWVFTLI